MEKRTTRKQSPIIDRKARTPEAGLAGLESFQLQEKLLQNYALFDCEKGIDDRDYAFDELRQAR